MSSGNRVSAGGTNAPRGPGSTLMGLLVCPACLQDLQWSTAEAHCPACGRRFAVDGGIPLLFHPHDLPAGDATETVRQFYEANPFPNYDDMDSRETLQAKARRGVFARLLDEQIPPGALVLEAGCGTGQLSNFLGMHWDRKMIGADLCLHSLRLAKSFRDNFAVMNAEFTQMNLFRPPFRSGAFDVVISNGVLHHTSDPLGGFRSIARLVKPGGLAVIGLYNTIGRLPTDFRRLIFRHLGDGFSWLDGHMRNPAYNQARKQAWFMDQYKHPRESKHSMDEVLAQWFDANGFDFLTSVPQIRGSFSEQTRLFEPHSAGTRMQRLLTQFDMLAAGGADGALFIMIGRKKVAG